MAETRQLSLRTIQRIANCIDNMKAAMGANSSEVVNYTLKWDVKTLYWIGRLRQFCEPFLTRIQDDRNVLVKKYGTFNGKGGYDFKEQESEEAFQKAIADLLDTSEEIRFPELKASQFVKMKDGKLQETLVPIDFWQIFTAKDENDVPLIDVDVKEFQIEEDEE